MTLNSIKSKRVIFWDFDGVIKDSVHVKTKAFETLFLPYGAQLAKQVREHHEAKGGMSRFEKIPLYLSWAGLQVDEERVHLFCDQFSELILKEVIDSPWVSGVCEYLQMNYELQYFVLVTATPQDEIEYILNSIGIAHLFREVYGAPRVKSEVIAFVLQQLNIDSGLALMIGDSENDLLAAQANTVDFLLRRTEINKTLQESYSGPQFDNLII